MLFVLINIPNQSTLFNINHMFSAWLVFV